MACINKSLPEYQALASFLTDDLAEMYVRQYSRESGLIDSFKIPSKEELIDYISGVKQQQIQSLTTKLIDNPMLSKEEIQQSLKGIVMQNNGQLELWSGWNLEPSLIYNEKTREMFFQDNLRHMNTLVATFPNIFTIEHTELAYKKNINILSVKPINIDNIYNNIIKTKEFTEGTKDGESSIDWSYSQSIDGDIYNFNAGIYLFEDGSKYFDLDFDVNGSEELVNKNFYLRKKEILPIIKAFIQKASKYSVDGIRILSSEEQGEEKAQQRNRVYSKIMKDLSLELLFEYEDKTGSVFKLPIDNKLQAAITLAENYEGDSGIMQVIKQAAQNDIPMFEQFLSNIAEQAADSRSVNGAIRMHGLPIVLAALEFNDKTLANQPSITSNPNDLPPIDFSCK